MVLLHGSDTLETSLDTDYVVLFVTYTLSTCEIGNQYIWSESLLTLLFRHGKWQTDGTPVAGTDGSFHPDVHIRGCIGQVRGVLIEHHAFHIVDCNVVSLKRK